MCIRDSNEAVCFTKVDADACIVKMTACPESRLFENNIFVSRIHDEHIDNAKAVCIDSIQSIEATKDILLVVAKWSNGDYGILATVDGAIDVNPKIYKLV